jgi:hypothetical protein
MVDNKKNLSKDLTNVEKDYILEESKPAKKKVGRPKNSELSNVKLALQAKKKLDKKNQKVKKLTRSLARVKKEVQKEENYRFLCGIYA